MGHPGFLRILRGGETHSDEAAHLARALSFDPDGIFQAFCVPARSSPEEDLGLLQQRLASHKDTIQIANQGTVTVIVCRSPTAWNAGTGSPVGPQAPSTG